MSSPFSSQLESSAIGDIFHLYLYLLVEELFTTAVQTIYPFLDRVGDVYKVTEGPDTNSGISLNVISRKADTFSPYDVYSLDSISTLILVPFNFEVADILQLGSSKDSPTRSLGTVQLNLL